MSITQITDYEDRAEGRLLEQYANKPRLVAWIRSYAAEVQELEDAAFDVLLLRLLDNAANAQLDTLGRIVREDRKERTDAVYRKFISARIKANRSTGHGSEVMAILRILTDSLYTFDEVQPATMVFELASAPDVDVYQMFQMLRDAKAGGVGLNLTAPTNSTPFTFSNAGDAAVPALGFISTSDSAGATGSLSTLFR